MRSSIQRAIRIQLPRSAGRAAEAPIEEGAPAEPDAAGSPDGVGVAPTRAGLSCADAQAQLGGSGLSDAHVPGQRDARAPGGPDAAGSLDGAALGHANSMDRRALSRADPSGVGGEAEPRAPDAPGTRPRRASCPKPATISQATSGTRTVLSCQSLPAHRAALECRPRRPFKAPMFRPSTR
jgi:hypothetical protein